MQIDKQAVDATDLDLANARNAKDNIFLIFTRDSCRACKLNRTSVNVALKKPRFHKVKALVIDVEEYPIVAKNLYVRSLPHTILYKQGVMTKIITSSYGMAAAEALLDTLL